MLSARFRFLTTPLGAAATLAVSVLLYAVITVRGAEPFAMIDLRVYYEGARHVWDDTTLYTFQSSAFGLPFTYPPIAAILFTGVAWLPWTLCRLLWQLASVSALAAICLFTQQLAAPPSASRPTSQQLCRTALLTAAALWVEPVRSTLNYGQVNLFICAVLLGGLTANRTWGTGIGLGICTAVKLIPGITVLYYLLAGRGRVVAVAAASVAGTIALGLLVAPHLTTQFFLTTVVNPGRAGNIDAVNNQSLRGALARILDRDDILVWGIAAAATLAVGAAAARACLRRRDHLGAFLTIQLVGLLVSPISWNHHWVWVLPLLIWAEAGPLRHDRIINTLSAAWALVVLTFVVSIQIAHQTTAADTPLTAWSQAIYPTLGAITILGVWAAHSRLSPHRTANGRHRPPAGSSTPMLPGDTIPAPSSATA